MGVPSSILRVAEHHAGGIEIVELQDELLGRVELRVGVAEDTPEQRPAHSPQRLEPVNSLERAGLADHLTCRADEVLQLQLEMVAVREHDRVDEEVLIAIGVEDVLYELVACTEVPLHVAHPRVGEVHAGDTTTVPR